MKKMKFYHLFAYNKLSLDIDILHKNYTENIDCLNLPVAEDLDAVKKYLMEKKRQIHDMRVDDIIGLMSEVGKLWGNKEYPLRRKLIDIIMKKDGSSKEMVELGIKYVSEMYSEENLKGITDADLCGSRYVLDRFINIYKENPSIMVHAQPMGIVGHWLSGNTLVAGQISLMRTMVTKNVNIIKVSSKEKYFLPIFLESFKDANYRNEKNILFNGSMLTDTVFAIFFDSKDKECNRELSMASNLRVARGGREAINTIINLEKQYGTEDVIYGPKYSFMVIGREYMESEELCRNIAEKAALDFSIWDQYACTSPHVAFVEKGGKVSPLEFARMLGEYMRKVAGILPNGSVSCDNSPNIINNRIEYDFLQKAVYPETTAWTILYSDNKKEMPNPIFSRVAHVFAIDNVFETIPLINRYKQSVGLALKGEKRDRYAEECTYCGVERCIPVGLMNTMPVGSPWDGFFNCNRMVRWVSTYGDDREQYKENTLLNF